jgi:2-dehydropantoate 2-reductase
VTRVCIVGVGAIGSLYAAHLARVADVVVLTRRDEHARALNEQGLRVTGRHDFTAQLVATTTPAELGDADLCIVATKATHLEQAAAALAGQLPGATVMTVQNGLGAEEVVRRYGSWPLISAVTFMSGNRHGDAEVEYILDTETWLGPYGDTPYETVERAADLIVRAELKARPFADLRPAQWSKLIFNATVNSVSALTHLPHVEHFADRSGPYSLGHLVHALVEEGKQVAAAAHVELHDDPWEMNVLATQRGSAHVPSMLEDIEAGRLTEIDLITGALVREAERAGVSVPRHEALYALVRAKEQRCASG